MKLVHHEDEYFNNYFEHINLAWQFASPSS